MKTLVEENRDRPYVALELAIGGGGLADPPGKEGLAYLTARMLLRGTARHSHAEFNEAVEHLGSFVDVGASKEWLSVRADALERKLPALFALLGDMFCTPAFPAAELEQLKRETLAQLQSLRDSDDALARLFFYQALYSGTPYGKPLYGYLATVPGIALADVKRYYAEHLRRDNLIAGAAGALSQAELQARLGEVLAALPAGAPPPTVHHASPKRPGRHLVLIDKPERTQVQLLIGQETVPAAHPDYFDLLVGCTAFGGTFSSPLSQQIREKRGWSYSAYSVLGVDRRTGTFVSRIQPRNEDAGQATALVLTLLEELVDQGLSGEAVDFAKSYLVRSFPFRVETPAKRLQQQLAALLLDRPADFTAQWTTRVSAVTPETVNAALRRHVRPADQWVVAVCSAPQVGDALARLPGVSDTKIHPYDADWSAEAP